MGSTKVNRCTLWLFNIAMERSTIFKNGEPSISMGHLYHGYVSHNQRVYPLWKITIFNGKFHYKWSFSIAVLNNQRVISKTGNSIPIFRIQISDIRAYTGNHSGRIMGFGFQAEQDAISLPNKGNTHGSHHFSWWNCIFLGNIPLFKHASRCFWWYHVYSAIQQIKIGTLVILTKISTIMIHHIQITCYPPYQIPWWKRCSLRTLPSRSIARDLAPNMFTKKHQLPGYVNSLSYWKWCFGGLVRGFTHSMVDLSINVGQAG